MATTRSKTKTDDDEVTPAELTRSKTTRSKTKTDDDEVTPAQLLRHLKKMEKTLQDLQTGQNKVETKLEAISMKLEQQDDEIRDLKKAMNYLSEEITSQTQSLNSCKEELHQQQEVANDQQMRLDTLQKLLDDSQRYSRGYNLRFLGIPEEEDPKNENCIDKIDKLLQSQLNLHTDIENAHRTGRSINGRPRHIIVKFLRRPQRYAVLRQRNMFKEGILVFEDLIPADLAARRKVKDVASEATRQGKRIKYVKGDLFIEGRRYVPEST